LAGRQRISSQVTNQVQQGCDKQDHGWIHEAVEGITIKYWREFLIKPLRSLCAETKVDAIAANNTQPTASKSAEQSTADRKSEISTTEMTSANIRVQSRRSWLHHYRANLIQRFQRRFSYATRNPA
jgi:hypothetical protein